jgi:chloramphenicol O-acetyltransferase type A
MTIRSLDLDAWPRREHFRFFLEYDQPFFNVCVDVDVSALLRRCRAPGGPSFFLASLWLSLRAANEVEEFHYRIRGKEVVVHDVVHGGSTVLRDDGTFCFAYFDFAPDFETFARAAGKVLVSARTEGSLDPRDDRDDLIHYSVIPWISFTSFSHARRRNPDDSTPKIVFGRYRGDSGAERMPVSVEVHHALMDGLHVGRFFERFQHHVDAFDPGVGGSG